MRIIGGRFKGKKIKLPKGGWGGVRPTADRVKEAIFNRIEHRFWSRGGIVDCSVLDLFAGSGALGIEALSRGAQKAVFVDSSPRQLKAIEDNVAVLGAGERAEFLCLDLLKGRHAWGRLCQEGPFDLIFADPPYRKRLTGFVLERVAGLGLLKEGGLLIIEEERLKGVEPVRKSMCHPGLFELEPRVYGRTVIRMWEKRQE